MTAAGWFGTLELAVLAVALAIATLAYLRMVRLIPPGGAWIAALTGLTAMLCAWAIPVAFSSDAYAYAVYGDRALRGLDPFARIALTGSDPLYVAARVQWGAALPACDYGWGFVGAAAVAVGIASPLGTAAQIAALRALASFSMLACGALALAAYSGGRAERVRAAVFIGCNPVALWCAAEGHNDALALAIGLLGLLRSPGGGRSPGVPSPRLQPARSNFPAYSRPYRPRLDGAGGGLERWPERPSPQRRCGRS